MKFYVEGKEITAEEAREINKKNKDYLNSDDVNDLLKVKFITVI